jgi:hypothetical protein
MTTRMTSPRIAAANHRNARLSTGPRTATGKQSAARNALRHGFRVPVLANPLLAEEVTELAEQLVKDPRLARGSTDPELRELAVCVAEAQVDIQRVRHARYALLARPAIGARELKQLCTLRRYEKLAVRRRKFAIRAWQAVLVQDIWGAP